MLTKVKAKTVFKELDKFNWGAFFLNPVWIVLCNKNYIALVSAGQKLLAGIFFALVLGLNIWSGMEGNERAWQGKKWNSIEEFNKIQKRWALAGLVIWIVVAIVIAINIYVHSPGFDKTVFDYKNKTTEQARPSSDIQGADTTKEPDFGPYMSDLQKRIKMNWSPPKGNESKRVVLLFSIDRDGHLLNVKVHQSSGISACDQAAIRAVQLTLFKPLPPEFKGNSVDIQFTFDYNVFGTK